MTVTPIRMSRAPKGGGAARVYVELRERILNLEFGPGTDLDEGALERLFGVSRTPVREALIRLASDGLVVQESNRGARVSQISLPSLKEFFEGLELVERALTRWAALRSTPQDLEEIARCRDEFQALAEQGNAADLNEANSRLHMAIATAGRNRYLLDSHVRLFAESLRLARLTLVYSSPDGRSPTAHIGRIADEHQGIVDAITAKDAERAERLAYAHIQLFRSRVLDYFAGETEGIRIDYAAHPATET